MRGWPELSQLEVEMNNRGHSKTLVAAHPGNLSAVKSGVYSPRLISEAALEIANELLESFQFTPLERFAVHEFARCAALVNAIDADLDARGVVDRRGRERSVVALRTRTSRQLERWLEKISLAIESQAEQRDERLTRDDRRRVLDEIIGNSRARPQDRIAAIKMRSGSLSDPTEYDKMAAELDYGDRSMA
jgi:hypothetical protein